MPGFDLDSSSQLDEILSELLNEASSPSKDAKQRRSAKTSGSDALLDTGSITTQSGNSRTVISWQTSSAAAATGPKTTTVTRQLTGDWRGDSSLGVESFKTSAAGQKVESRSATIKRENAVNNWKDGGGGSATVGRPGKTPPPPPVRRRLTSADEVIGVSAESKTAASRWDGEGGGGGGGTTPRNCASDTEETRSWLDDQIWKLQAKKTSGRSYQQHTHLEKQLIADLKNRLGLGGGGGAGGGRAVTQSDVEEDGGLGESTGDSSRKKKPLPPQPPQRNKDSGTHVINITFDASKSPKTESFPSAAAAVAAAANDVFSLSQSDTEIKSLLAKDPKPPRISSATAAATRTQNETTSVRLFRTASDNEVTVPKASGARGAEERPAVRREPVVRSSSLGDDSSKPTYKAKASFYVSGIERPAFSTHQTKYTFSVNPLLSEEEGGGDQQSSSSRLPPVPPSRCSAPTSPVAPKRGDSSREALLKSQRRMVCSPNIDEIENSLRLIVEQQPQTNSSAPEKDVVDQRKVTSPVRDIDDEVIVLKPIGPGIQTLEPDSTGTLKRPMTPLIPLSVTNNADENTLRKIRDSADNINSLGRPNQQSQVNVQYSSETIKEVRKQGSAPNYVTQPLGIGDPRLIMTQQQPQQQQQTLPQQQSLQQQQQQQQQQWQQQLQQFYSSQQPSFQHPSLQQPLFMSLQPQPVVQSLQQQAGPWEQQQQQQTLQRQQSWPLQQPTTQQPQLQHSNMPLSSMKVTTEVIQQRILQQQPNLAQHGSQQPLLTGLPNSQQLVGGQQQGSNLYNKHQNQEAFVNQGGQRIDAQSGVHQFGPQMLNAQQMGGQMASSSLQNTQTTGQQNHFYGQNVEAQQFNQANNLQLMERQLTNVQPQMIGGQTVQQAYAQQMGVYQNAPKFPADHGGIQQERSKYVTIEHTTSTLPRNGTLSPNGLQQINAVQNTVDIPQQFQLNNVQNHGQLLQQQQLHFQQEQQQQIQQQQIQQQQIQQQQNQQQQAYTRVFQSSSAEQMQNERQRVGSSMTLDNRAKSPVQLGSPSSVGSWPYEGYSDTLRSQTLQVKRSGTNPQFVDNETLMRSKSPSLMRAASPASIYNVQFRNGSLTSLTDGFEFANTMPRFVRDTSKYWHKPNISREEAINMLRDKPPGTFVVRNSTTFQGGFGLALKVAQLPPNVQAKGDDLQANLVRHFLIESNSKGVRLKGCSNEPVFGSLAALIYQHSITPLALPCKLHLPTADAFDEMDKSNANTLHSSVCNTLYVESINTESLTGPEALSRSIAFVFGSESFTPKATPVQLKVSSEGITLTDNRHRLFFRRHYPLNTVSFCGKDGIDRRLPLNGEENVAVSGKIFGFVARKSGGNGENACHLFLNTENNESASSIVDLVTKVMMGQGQFMKT